jgi:hypothetical protein
LLAEWSNPFRWSSGRPLLPAVPSLVRGTDLTIWLGVELNVRKDGARTIWRRIGAPRILFANCSFAYGAHAAIGFIYLTDVMATSPSTEFVLRFVPALAGQLDWPVCSGCVSSQRERAITVGSTPAFLHHAASSPQRWTSRWCPRHNGTVNSSLTLRPRARLCAKRRWWASAGRRPQIRQGCCATNMT